MDNKKKEVDALNCILPSITIAIDSYSNAKENKMVWGNPLPRRAVQQNYREISLSSSVA